MARSTALAVIVGMLSIGTGAAAPQPKDNKPVITLETVNRLKPVAEKDHDVYRFVWGPKVERTHSALRGPDRSRRLMS